MSNATPTIRENDVLDVCYYLPGYVGQSYKAKDYAVAVNAIRECRREAVGGSHTPHTDWRLYHEQRNAYTY